MASPFGGGEPPKPVVTPAEPDVYMPTYEEVEAYGPLWYVEEAARKLGLRVARRYMNPLRFASEPTAEWVRGQLGGVIFQRTEDGSRGPFFTCSKLQRWIRIGKREFLVGLLADTYARNAGLRWVPDTPGTGHYERDPDGIKKNRHANGLAAMRSAIA